MRDIPLGIVINRSNLGNKKTENCCKRENIPISYDDTFLINL